MNATDIVGYTYRTETLCPACTVDAVAADSGLLPPLRGISAEEWLEFMAIVLDINRQDERCFDSEEFPKVIFASQVEGAELCGGCYMDLVERDWT